MLKFLSLLLIGTISALLFLSVKLILKQPKSLHTAGLNKPFRFAVLLIIVLGPVFSLASFLSPKEIMPLLVSCAVAVNYYFFLIHYYAYANKAAAAAATTAVTTTQDADQPMTNNKFLIRMHKLFSPTRDPARSGDIRTSTSRIDSDLSTIIPNDIPTTTTSSTTSSSSSTTTTTATITNTSANSNLNDSTNDDTKTSSKDRLIEINNDYDDDDDGRMSRDENGFMRRRLPPMVVCLRVCLMVVLSSALPAFFFGTGGVISAHSPPTLRDKELLSVDNFLLGWIFPKGQFALWMDNNSVFGPTSVLGSIIVDLLTIIYVSYYLWSYIIMIIYIWRAISHERKQSLKSEVHAWDTAEGYMSCWIFSFVMTFIINILCPAKSPRIYIKDDYKNPLDGFGLRHLIGGVIHQDDSFGSFPSGHVGETLAVALASYYIGFTPKFSKFCLVVTFLVGVATLWLRYHYFVDVLAGVVVAYVALFMSGVKPLGSLTMRRRATTSSSSSSSSTGSSSSVSKIANVSDDNDDEEALLGGDEMSIDLTTISSSSSSQGNSSLTSSSSSSNTTSTTTSITSTNTGSLNSKSI